MNEREAARGGGAAELSLAKGPTLVLEGLGPLDVIHFELFLFLMGKGSPGGNLHLI